MSHLLPFILPVSVFFFLLSGPHSIEGALAWTTPFWTVLLADWLSPEVTTQQQQSVKNGFYDGILYGLAVLQMVNVGLMLDYISRLEWTSSGAAIVGLANLVAVRFLVGTSSGTSGIVVAHELIHRPQWPMQQLGRLLLCSVCYEHFVITHKRGHHLNIGMPQDIAMPHLGESFHDYWKRIYTGNLRYAWRSEQDRLGLPQNPWGSLKSLHNRVLHGLLAELILVVSITVFFGWIAAFMFLYQAFAAVRILEAVNYFQHWGLEDGRYGHSYGWVNNSWLTSYALIGLSNHIGHHQNEKKHFYEIAYSDQGPKMPYGYFIMNLWVKLNNDSYQKMAMRELQHYRCSQRS
ncbi:fatty acid desaturase [Candidatus Methylobacter favarea]|uniref:fatty acid desaturase n=1 Tax=Candidatus Methylobacter favarea TaxID=2707345 RepID=UPI001FEAAE8F|nr:fatty acid desaturase [Candidatus Methylobacter favarea]